jgi:hypothetical protein
MGWGVSARTAPDEQEQREFGDFPARKYLNQTDEQVSYAILTVKPRQAIATFPHPANPHP